MIINLCGPPAAGKSTFAARFTLEHPQFKFCPIDEYRIRYQDEGRAWAELTKDVLGKRNCILESCGMGWQLNRLLNFPKVRRRPLLSIAFLGNKEDLLSRLRERQKRPLPDFFNREDELLALDYALEHFEREVESVVHHKINTSSRSEASVYDEVNFVIQRELLLRGRNRKIRKDRYFPDMPPLRETRHTRARAL